MCKRAGVKYRPPHSLRHGNAFYGLELAQDSADRKAVSLNLMHKNLSTTDETYGIPPDNLLQARIANLRPKESQDPDEDYAVC